MFAAKCEIAHDDEPDAQHLLFPLLRNEPEFDLGCGFIRPSNHATSTDEPGPCRVQVQHAL
jgi:hypothetical protein